MIRLERRLDAPRWLRAAIPFISLALAFVIAGIVLEVTGHNALSTYTDMYNAAFINPGGLTGTFVYATPLLFTGLCAAIAFRMRVWNIGGEGQLYLGAVGASGVGLLLGGWPTPLIILAMIAAGALAGLLWAAIPGLLRAYGRTNEILTSLMLNYVAGYLIYYLIYDSSSYWRDLTSFRARVFPLGKYLSASAFWPGLNVDSFVVPLGFFVGVVVAVLLFALIRSTGFGFEMRVVADSPAAADYAGIRTRRRIVYVMLISGAIAGIGGASQVGDFGHVLDPRGLQQAGYGYTGIVVAALALYEPLAAVLIAFLLGALNNAGFALQGPDFPIGLVGVMEGTILFCVLGSDLLIRYRIRLLPRSKKATLAEIPPVGAKAEP
ncbi:MAG TPA: ABC transporter permease [Candidatus Udaeobacter sp.]|nr:ABC transporter permease [Candidatus Udaeobacter sp.]